MTELFKQPPRFVTEEYQPEAAPVTNGRYEPEPVESQDDEPDIRFRRWTMPEVLDEPREFTWLMEGMLVNPTYGMVAGEMKTLKSYVSTFIDLALATGTTLFGQFPVPSPVNVLAYVGEGGRIPWTNRTERIAWSMGLTPRDVPLFPSFDSAPIMSAAFQESLRRDIDEVEPALVHIDPYYAYHGAATKASDLHAEGALLSNVSNRCMSAGASLIVNNHFNQTGEGRGLKRITMAGGGEWVDSWVLLSHRVNPDVENGRFFLSLEVGSRQWGGTTWDLDLELGRFDIERGEFDGAISWDIRRGSAGIGGEAAKVTRAVERSPWTMTKSDVVAEVGGKAARVREAVDELIEAGELVYTKGVRKDARGHNQPCRLLGPRGRDVVAEDDPF